MGKSKLFGTKCELALMGKLVPFSDEEVVEAVEYMMSAMGIERSFNKNFVEQVIQKYNKDNHVDGIVCHTVYGLRCITFCLKYSGKDKDYAYPAPLEEDWGTGYPSAFSYVLNLDCDWCSEFGDSFFEKREDGYYHRVS